MLGFVCVICIIILRACVLSHFSHVRLFVTLWTVAHQPPLCLGFSRQEHWSELLFPSLGDLCDPGFEPVSFASLALTGRFSTTSTTWEAHYNLKSPSYTLFPKFLLLIFLKKIIKSCIPKDICVYIYFNFACCKVNGKLKMNF